VTIARIDNDASADRNLSVGFARVLTNLTAENRSKIPPGPTNLQKYLQRDEIGEQIVIEMETQHQRTPLTLGLQNWEVSWQGLGRMEAKAVESEKS
jgi:hypothetical protein